MNQAAILAVTSLGSYRVWRLIAWDRVAVFRRPREWAVGKLGQDHWATELVTCSWCLGTWVTFAVVAVTAQFVSMRVPVVHALAAATIVGLLARVDDL